ncbi:MAG: hypothetical protein IPO95_14345 [Rhodanobacteraceae bacterium]|nr:hypothetical protein [Rhodanobacteraceae bacterium]
MVATEALAEPCMLALVTTLLVAPPVKRIVDVPLVAKPYGVGEVSGAAGVQAVDGDVVGAVEVDQRTAAGGGNTDGACRAAALGEMLIVA